MTCTEYIQSKTNLPKKGIENTVKLLEDDCTIPFISRYRKDVTGNLDEVQIEQISSYKKEYDTLLKRKMTIKKAIQEQDALAPLLEKALENCWDAPALEDLYLPYKKSKKTRANAAKDKGLEPLAKLIFHQNDGAITKAIDFVNKAVKTENEALQGARDIIAEWVNEDIEVRSFLRKYIKRTAKITSKVVKSKESEEEAKKYQQYFDWEEGLSKIPSHRLLAILRAENEGYIKVNTLIETEDIFHFLENKFCTKKNNTTTHLEIAIKDAYKRLLEPSISNECLQEAKKNADKKAISIFAENLRQLLLAPPLGEKRILGIDPGYKSGCKIVCIDEKGDLLHNETIYPHAPQMEVAMGIKKIKSLVNSYHIDAISIGNGTASRETEIFIKKIALDRPIQVFMVSEAGASVYSASKIAREEFPMYDVTVRGAVSIARRLADPLAELVKIDPQSIGVGQYQHDVDAQELKNELDNTVIKCVNSIGINLNTASKSLLSYVSGIGEKLAENIVKYREDHGAFRNRMDLKKVPRLGEKAFQQSVAFFRIKNGENPLDCSAVHPEAYPIIDKMAKDLKTNTENLIGNKDKIATINPEHFTTEEIGVLGISEILKELEKPNIDPRKAVKAFSFDPNVNSFKDVKKGMTLPGIVNNITAFGCFVDLGIKESGLLHISQLRKEFISDVNEVVSLHQQLMVKVLEIDEERKRIQLTLLF